MILFDGGVEHSLPTSPRRRRRQFELWAITPTNVVSQRPENLDEDDDGKEEAKEFISPEPPSSSYASMLTRSRRLWRWMMLRTRYHGLCFVAFLTAFVTVSFIQERIIPHHIMHDGHRRRRQLQLQLQSTNNDPPIPQNHEPHRILYIVTSIAEYDNGRRSTKEGNDRFTNTLVPVLIESVRSILSASSSDSFSFRVDVYLITHYPMTTLRYHQLRSQLPVSVGLQIWDNATPYGYMQDTPWTNTTTTTTTTTSQAKRQSPQERDELLKQQQQQRLQLHTRGLSRQHRFVIKDKLYFYDSFINVEDDMLIHKEHVLHYLQMTNTIYQLRQRPPENDNDGNPPQQTQHKADPTRQFYGPMTEQQLERTIPGFVRVEVVLDENADRTTTNTQPSPLLDYFQTHPISKNPVRTMYHNIPRDYEWFTSPSSTTTATPIQASICCHVTNNTWQQQQRRDNTDDENKLMLSSPFPPRRRLPTANDLYFWEMSIESLGVRQMPKMRNNLPVNNNSNDTLMFLNDLDWVMLLGGSNNELFIKFDPSYIIGDYWSGQYLMETLASSSNRPLQRPDRRNGKYVTNQGGWMGTRRQIIEWHTRWCRGGFLPYVHAFFLGCGCFQLLICSSCVRTTLAKLTHFLVPN